MAIPAPATDATAIDENGSVTLNWQYNIDWFGFSGNDGSLGGFNEGLWYDSGSVDSFDIEINENGTGWVEPTSGPSTVTHDDSGSYSEVYSVDATSSQYEFRVRATNVDGSSSWLKAKFIFNRTITSYSSQISSTSIRVIDVGYKTESYATSSGSSSKRLIDVLATPSSASNLSSSSSQRTGIDFEERTPDISYSGANSSNSISVIDLSEDVQSYTTINATTADRSQLDYEGREPDDSFSALLASDSIGVIDVLESVKSHSDSSRTFTYNDRTSLELIDHAINWNDNESFWYTNWFQETRILGTEDELAIRSLVVPESKEPAAIVLLQYDSNGNGEVNAESDPIRLGRDQQVHGISGVPIDENGYYRIKIMEYSGYNSLYAIDTAIVN